MRVRGIGFSKVLGLIIVGTSNSTYKFCRLIGMDIVTSYSISNCETPRLPFESIEIIVAEMQALEDVELRIIFLLSEI